MKIMYQNGDRQHLGVKDFYGAGIYIEESCVEAKNLSIKYDHVLIFLTKHDTIASRILT